MKPAKVALVLVEEYPPFSSGTSAVPVFPDIL